MTSDKSAAPNPAALTPTRHRPPRTGVVEGLTAVVVILDPDGHVQVIDLLTHPDGPRLLDGVTADPQDRGLTAETYLDDDADETSVDPHAGNVVRLPVPQLPRLLRGLPTPQVSGPYGRPVLIEDHPDEGAVRWVGFSPREFEVLQLIVAGYSNQQIAEHLYLGINTVKSYVRTSYRKIPVTSRSQAVRWGFLHGLGLGFDGAESGSPGPRREPTTIDDQVGH